MPTRIPGNAVDPQAIDIGEPTEDLLRSIQLLPSRSDLGKADGITSAFSGPPQSVAVIEAGATAFSKWWAAGLGTSLVGVWSSITGFWGDQDHATQRMVLLAAAIATAAVVVALGYIVGSDVRGRAAASVATIQGRVEVARNVLAAAQATYVPPTNTAEKQVLALPETLGVSYLARPAADEADWKAVAVEVSIDGGTRFLIVKGAVTEWVQADGLDFAV